MGKTVIITLHADAGNLFNADRPTPDPKYISLSDSNEGSTSTGNWEDYLTEVHVGQYAIWEGICLKPEDKIAGYSVSIDSINRKPEFFETRELGFRGRNGIVTAKVQSVKPEYNRYSYQIHFSIHYQCRSKCFVIDPKLIVNN
ncbi:MAG: hypothetical protein MUO53_16120 [Maribacter sp.]|nr:hypothetical protein [Maribacter sp.]